MTDIIELIAKTYGIVGLLMVAPVASTVWLWLHIVKTRDEARLAEKEHTAQLLTINDKHSAEIKQLHVDHLNDVTRLNQLNSKVQDQRVADAQEVVTKLITTVSEQSAMNAETNLALERMGDFIALGQAQTKALPPGPKGGNKGGTP